MKRNSDEIFRTSFISRVVFTALICNGYPLLNAQTLNEVVVSASREAQRSFDAPASIQVVDETTISNAGPQVNLSESLNRVPGLTILNRQNYAQDLQLSVRGFGARSTFGVRGVRLLIDGIPATTPDGQGQGSSISLTSTARIEVLRGPFAQLYGNSAGGVIQAFTRDAPAVAELDTAFYTGSFGLQRADLQYAGQIGRYGLVMDYSTFSTDGFRANSVTERKQFNGKLSFNANEDTKVNVVFNQFDMPLAQDPLGLTASQLAANPEQAGSLAVADRARKTVLQNQLGTSIIHTIDTQQSITARLYYGTRDNLQYQAIGAGSWVGLNRDYYGAGLQYNAQTRIADMPVTWVAGYEYDRSNESRQGGSASGGEKTSAINRNEDNLAQNSDLFIQGTALVSEKITASAGLRSSQVRLASQDLYLKDGDGSGSITYSATNPVAGITYHASDELNVYATYGKGFESPTLAELAYNGSGAPAFNTNINASKSQHYELGAKWAPNDRARVDFTLYKIDTENEIVVASSTGGKSTFTNAPGTQRTGWELSSTMVLADHWRALVSASGINAHFSQTYTSSGSTVNTGNQLPGIPKSFLFSELTWSSEKQDVKAANIGTRAGLELTHAGQIYANDLNTATADTYTIWNAKLSHAWALGKAKLTAYSRIDNLMDRKYVGSVIVNQTSTQFYEPAPGRTWTVGLRLNMPL